MREFIDDEARRQRATWSTGGMETAQDLDTRQRKRTPRVQSIRALPYEVLRCGHEISARSVQIVLQKTRRMMIYTTRSISAEAADTLKRLRLFRPL